MEEAGKQRANDTILCPRTSHPQRASAGQDNDEQALSLVRSLPSSVFSPSWSQGATLNPQRVSYSESNSFTDQRQVAGAGDTRPQFLFPKLQLFFFTSPGNLADRNAARTFLRPSDGIVQEEIAQTYVVEEDSPNETRSHRQAHENAGGESSLSEDSSNETKSERQAYERDRRFRYLNLNVALYKAALKDDWKAAEALIKQYPHLVQDPITVGHMRALHVAAVAKRTNFVKELVKYMTEDDVALRNKDGNTALCFAAASGIVTIAEEMVKKNQRLPSNRDNKGMTPLLIAALLGHRHMVSYLFSVTPFGELDRAERINLLLAAIASDMYDIAWEIFKKDQTLATAQDENGKTALHKLAKKPFAIGSKSQLSIWKSCLNSLFNGFRNKALMQTSAHQLVEGLWKGLIISPEREFSNLFDLYSSFLFDAAQVGNVEFLIILVRSYPDVLWKVDKKNRSLFHIAVLHRQRKVYNLIYEIGAIKDIIAAYVDENKDNMLHLVGKLPSPNQLNMVSGAALQMQRELLWFKGIEKIMPPPYVRKKNLFGKTPWDIFTEEHKALRKDGEEWMKYTANQCMLMATLIATVIFAAAFTVPGGNDQVKGTPILFERNWFKVFFISDTIALISSSTSILIFLSILTSRYTEEDFLESLPSRLMFGLTTLFFSITSMIVAFSASCFLVYDGKKATTPSVILASAAVPVILFVWLHYKLWADIIRSTYWSRFLFQPCKHRLF